jgi:hypothetical protein
VASTAPIGQVCPFLTETGACPGFLHARGSHYAEEKALHVTVRHFSHVAGKVQADGEGLWQCYAEQVLSCPVQDTHVLEYAFD